MKPPVPFKTRDRVSYSVCMCCDKWTPSNNYFRHEGTNWILCRFGYADYWENTDELQDDYKVYKV